MTKRRSLIGTFAFAAVLSLALIFGIALTGGTLTAQAAGAPDSVSVDGHNLYNGYYLESNESTAVSTGATTEPANYVAWYQDGVLTLNDYDGGQISAGGDVRIKLKGENTITESSRGIFVSDCKNLVIDADSAATLHIKVSSSTGEVCGISVGEGSVGTIGNVTIEGKATVNIHCDTTSVDSSYGIYAKETFTIAGSANLSVKCKFSHENNIGSYCILSGENKPVFDTDGTVTLDISESAYPNYCISANSGIDMRGGTLICRYKKGNNYSYAFSRSIEIAPEGCVLREEPYSLGETVIKSGAGHTLTVENGVEHYQKNTNQYVEGETVEVKATIDDLPFVRWEGEGVTFADATQRETTFPMPDRDVTVRAVYDVFAKQPVFERINDGKGSISLRLNKPTSGIGDVRLLNSAGEVDINVSLSRDSESEDNIYGCSMVWASYTPGGMYRIRVEYNGYYFYSEPFEIDYTDKTPAAKISDVTVNGKTGRSMPPVSFDIILSFATFREIAADIDVSDWFSRLPEGLVAKIDAVSEGASSATVTISGTPKQTSMNTVSLNIPKEVLATGNDAVIGTKYNSNAKFNIVAPTRYKVTVTRGKAKVGETTKTSIEEGSTVTLIADTIEGYVFEKWVVRSGGVTLADETAATPAFTMPESDVVIEAIFKELPHVHVYKSVPERAATCIATGMRAHWTCEGCGKLFDEDRNETTAEELTIAIEPDAHEFGTVQARVASTCVATGTREHKDCTRCGKHFTADGTTEITDLTLPIDPAAHDLEAAWRTTKDGHCHGCRNEGCPVGHDEIKAHTPDRAAATETDPVKCTECGYIISPIIGHRHRLTAVLGQDATCTKDGRKTYYACAGCELKFKDEAGAEEIADESWLVIPRVHRFGAWVDEVPATTGTAGTKAHKTCDLCGKHFDEHDNEIADLTIEKLEKPTYPVTIGGGTGGGEFEAGQTITITANEAPEGKEFDKWVVVSGEITLYDVNSATTTFVMPDGNVEIKATYKDKTPSGGGEEPGGETPGTDNPGGETPGTDDPSGEIKPTPDNEGLSGGAIAGIVVGSVAVVGIGGFAIFWFAIKKKTFAELIAAIKGVFKKK